MPPSAPRVVADTGPMYAAAGVTTTRPTTIAVAAPTAVTVPPRNMSSSVHDASVAAGASSVLVNARVAVVPADSALPALKPNQPNHNRPAPSIVKGTLCGRIAWRP